MVYETERDAAPLFAALGDETRLRLLSRLSADGALSTGHLTASSAMSRQAVTKHLDILREAGWVRSSRQGRERVWELETERFQDARAYLEGLSRQWDEALGRLKALVEG